MKIGIQGVQHSYHHQAALQFFGKELTQLEELKSFSDLFSALQNEEIEAAVCAVENTIYGGISEVYDLLMDYPEISIGGEVIVAIDHVLAAATKLKLDAITEVYSHPVALEQCSKFLANHFEKSALKNWQDTSAAAQMIADNPGKPFAAICSKSAAITHGLHILFERIANYEHNTTRFFILYKKPPSATLPKDKTSLVLDVAHTPGALYDTLSAFKLAGINLTMLVSRPIPNQLWQYRFFIDVEAGIDEPGTQLALSHLKNNKLPLRVLGSYRRAKQL